MTMRPVITVYSDYKSPYAYLARDPVWALEAEGLATVVWRPYVLDILDTSTRTTMLGCWQSSLLDGALNGVG